MAYVYHVELTSQCNLSCTYCTLTFSKRSVHGHMSEETFRKVVAHMAHLSPLNLMVLHHFGEPLLHPDLPEFLAIAAAADLNPGFSTNGELLTPEGLEELIAHGLQWLCITFHTERGRAAYEACRDVARRHRLVYWGRELVEEPMDWDHRAMVNFGIERQLLHAQAGRVEHVDPQPPGWTPRCDFLERQFVCVLFDGRVVPCAMDEHGQEVLGTVDDLAAIEQKPAYELCRTCEGFRFYESFRSAMRDALAEDTKSLKTTRWHPSLPLDAEPRAGERA